MNLHPSARLSRKGAPRLQLISMIDIIFLLLLYFILTTTHEPPESQLVPALQVQRDASGRSSQLTPQIVDVRLVDRAPAFQIGANVVHTRFELTDILRRLPKEQGVIIRGDDRVTTRWAAAALQSARDAGFGKVTYVPAQEEQARGR